MRPSRLAGLALLAGALPVWLQGCDGSTEPQPVGPVHLTATTATSLAGVVGTDVSPAPAVRATDDQDRPVAGTVVTFRVATGAGTVSTSKVTTNADGLAVLGSWTLGGAAGTQTLTAALGDAAGVTFTVVANPGPLAQITPVSGNSQLAGVGKVLEQPLVAAATDAFGNPVAGVPIVFSVDLGDGSIDGAAVVTDAAGQATALPWRLGFDAGVQHVRAALGSDPHEPRAEFRAFAAPAPGTLAGKLAFVSYADPYLDIAVANADGSGFTRLSRPGPELDPAWSPDGSRIAFSGHWPGIGDESSMLISVMSADGTNVFLKSGTQLAISPAWSPDGSTLAFTDLSGSPPSVATVEVVGSGPDGASIEADLIRGAMQPSWSPDGSKLAFASMGPGFMSIATANANGSGLTRLTSNTSGMEAQRPAWSPDGTMIAFVYHTGASDFRVAVMAADGTFLKDLASAGPSSTETPGSIAWSPDGSGVAFSFFGCEPPATGCFERSIKYVSLDGSRLVTLIPDAQSPSWR